mmetsp:Transcript_2561/g.4237  ORF Transcript_2561/g.4237 Transcript_2561/m.4237 type:complete len:241 (+) Transcript_2561:588-1310(+)
MVLFAQEILHGNLYIFKGNVTGASRARVHGLDKLGLNALALGDEQHGDASCAGSTGPHGSGKVICKARACDPLFGTVDNVVASIRGQLGCGPDAGYITPRESLGDSQADTLAAGENLRNDLLLHPLGAIVDQRWGSDRKTSVKRVRKPRALKPAGFLLHDLLVGVVKLFWLEAHGHREQVEVLSGPHASVQQTGAGQLLHDLKSCGLVALLAADGQLSELLVIVLAHKLTPSHVLFVVVR